MFSRIREAIRIITYREPNSGPDAVIVERVGMVSTGSGKRIARFLEATVGILTIGYASSWIGEKLFHFSPLKQSASVTVLVGSVAMLLAMITHWIKGSLEAKFRAHLHLADALAPYFGKRLDNVSRVLRGSVRAS